MLLYTLRQHVDVLVEAIKIGKKLMQKMLVENFELRSFMLQGNVNIFQQFHERTIFAEHW